MVLVHAVALLIIIVISVIFLGRFFAKVVEILAHYFARLDVTIDTFGLFSVRGIKIKLNGQRTLIIESISLQTKWTYSNSRKVFTILFGKVELIQDVQVGSQEVKDKAKKSNSIIASHSERVSQIVNLLCQYLAISFCDVSVIVKLPRDRLMQCELRQGLDLVANPNGRWLNCLMSAKKIETQITTTNSNGLCDTLVKLTVEFIVEASLQPLQGIKSADVQVTLHSVSAVINDGFLINNINSSSPTRTDSSLNEENALSSNSELTRDIWLQLANIPKHMQVHTDKICISFVNRDQRNLRLDISQVVTIFEQKETEVDINRQCDVNLVISGVSATGIKSCELCTLNRLRFTSKIYEYNSSTHVGASVCIESLHNNYVHDECLYWLEYLKSRLREKKEDKRSLTGYNSNRGIEFKLPVKVDVEMIDCSTCLFLNHERADQPLCRAVLASCVVNIDIPRMGVDTDNASHRIRMETRLENAYIYFDALKTLPESFDSIDTTSYTLPDNPSLLPNTNNHVWGRTLAMGTFALQCDVEMPALDNKPMNVRMKAEASCLSVEWSHQVCTAILHLSKQFTTTNAMATTRKINNETPNRTKICMDTEIRLRGVNIFYLGTRESGVDSFVYRTDMVVVTIPVTEPASLEAFGLNISRMVGLKRAPYKCHLSRDISDPCLSVPVITASLTKDKIISCSVNDTLVNWDPTLHMALNDRIQEITQDIASVKGIFMRKIESEERKAQKTNSTVMTRIKCEISAFKLDMKTSSSTRFGIQFAKSNINLQANDLSVVIETAAVLFDNNNTFSFENVKLQRSSQMQEVQNVRKEFVNLTTANNITWIISAQETRVCFPHQFDFASSRSELVNIAKMLKTLHRKPHDSSDTGSLPPDLWLRFGKIIFEIEDDPFEVKLGVNYTLLLDEAKHWSDRMETLQNRLKTIRMTPGNSLTVQKEIMLHKKLLEKNAELYIQRSKAFYHEFPMRTSLLKWEIEGLDLMVLADESYHGKHKAVETMMTLNTESTFPGSDMDFSTLWCRTVKGTLASHCVKLRDYPQSIFTSKKVRLSGTFLAAEQAARDIAKYDSKIVVDKPWNDVVVQRSLTVLKYYYDLDFDVDTLELAWGVDTEPALAMVSLAFDHLSKPSKDPSKPLPFYDKIRLLLHGRLHMDIKQWLMFFSAARNPYERTERMEVDWSNVDLLWTNGHIEIVGDFDLQTRTASRYDDRQVLHLPVFKVCADMKWNCTGNANDHFSVMPFAPSKLPELAPNQIHDTYAAFRSQSLSLHISLETAIDRTKYNNQGPPNLCLYASTFRWFKKYQEVVLRYTSRPIKRGKYFKRIPVKKKALGRHYKEVSLSLKFPELSVWYWGSFSQQRGFEVKCGLGSLQTQYRLALRPFDGDLTRRPAADWTATKLHVQIRQITCHLYGVEQADGQVEGDETEDVSSIDLEPTKYYFLTTESLEYYRQDSSKPPGQSDDGDEPDSQSFNHQLVCHGSKGVWTLTNRRIIFGLFEAYTNAEVLKKNLSADALKITIVEKKQKTSPVSPDVSTMKPRSMSLLQKLVSEKDSKFTVFTEEGTGTVEPSETALQGVALCSIDDVISHTWHIKLVNSQILLQGTETKGGVLVTAGNTTVLNRLHRPVWSKTELLNKKTWVGKLENLQYFATVSPEDSVNLNNIPWLDISVITGRQAQEKTGFDIADLANIVGSGEAVGGVVTAIVGGATAGQDVPQLQRIVARCGCEFYFVNFSSELDPLAESMTPNLVPQSPASSNHLRVNRLPTVDTYTIRHKLLEISTNSSQYLMLIDIVNNVVLYTEPKKKEAIERLQKMTFRLQLSAIEDQRGQILKQQNIVRSHQGEMKILQRDLYELNLMRKQALDNQELIEAMVELERNISNKKELLNSGSTELKLLISAYKDFQMNLSTPTPEKAPSARADPTKLAEVHFNHVSWQLNQADGQLEIADVTFRNFSYSKTTLTDATIEHRFEIPKFNVRNLLPNSIYKDVLMQNSVSGQGQKDRSVMVRLYCRVKPPVAGIGIKEHLEVNVCPLSVGLTHRLFSKIMVFFFPQRAHEYESDVTDVDLFYKGGADQDEKDFGDDDLFTADDLEDVQLKTTNLKRCPSTASSISSSSDTSVDSSKGKKSLLTSHTDASPSSPGAKDKGPQGKKKSTFYRPLEEHDDLEKMKERASKNHSFIYVKVTEVLLCVSYKGEKEKNIVDVRNFNLTLPTLEYHNRTWTWHDLLIAMKKDCINVLVSQIIKEKLHLKGAHGMEGKDAKSQPREEDKAKLLFGDRSKTEKKKAKKSLLGKLVKKTLNTKHSGLLQPDGAGPEPVNLEGEVYQQRSDEEQEPEELPEETQ